MKEKDKTTQRNLANPPVTFRAASRQLLIRFARAAKKDNRPKGYALNQAMEDYCVKMGV
jgi:hypothetical protein